MSLRTTFKQLAAALHELVSQDAVLHDRLGTALEAIAKLQSRDFPPDLRGDYDRLESKSKFFRPWVHQPEIEAEIALGILDLGIKMAAFTGMIPT